jgi:hypothetical protein
LIQCVTWKSLEDVPCTKNHNILVDSKWEFENFRWQLKENIRMNMLHKKNPQVHIIFMKKEKKFQQRGFNKKFSNRFVLKPSTTHGKKKSTHPHMCP